MNHVVAGLIYLRTRSMRNALLARIRRLKQPKYLIGAIVGVAYVYFAFLRRVGVGRSNGNLAASFPVEQLPAVVTVCALLVLVFIALCWVWPRERAALAFSEAEIGFLFPAPLARRTLIHYRLIDSQLRLIFTSLILALLSSGWNFLMGGALIRIFGWWLVFTTISLHITGSAFVITNFLDRGVSESRRQLIAGAVILAIVAFVSIGPGQQWRAPRPDEATDFRSLSAYLTTMINQGALGILLTPVRWLVQPLFATDALSFSKSVGPALLIFALHYVWVLVSETSFEEASIVRAQKRAARVAAMRSGNMRLGRSTVKARQPPFDIAKLPRAEFAFVWKNLLSSAGYLRPRTALVTAGVIVVFSLWLRSGHETIRAIMTTFALVSSVYILIFGPMLARLDLRRDLGNADILKTYPLRGWQVVLGQILTPVIVISVLLWLVLLVAALNLPVERLSWASTTIRVWGAIAIALLVPIFCAIEVIVLNAGTLFFPAWLQTGQSRNSGIDVFGQRILFFAGLLLSIVVAVLPAALIAGIVYVALQWFLNLTLAFALAYLALLAVLVVEIGVGIELLGKQFERFDLSAELRP